MEIKNMNAVIYARYSSDKQTEQSIEGQLRDCYAYAERCGYKVVGEYIDRAMTGRYDDRDQFQKMIADSSKKQFQFIIVYKLDRFARNRYDSAIYKRKLKLNNVRVISAMEGISDTPEGIILEAVLEANAEYYSANLSQNVKRGMRESAFKGLSTGGNIPLGYRIVDKHLVVDEMAAPIVKYIFDEYAAGKTKTQIANALQEKGCKTKHGKPFTVNNFTHILKNKIYTGDYTFCGEIERTCPAIIDKELFEKCQDRIDKNKIARGRKVAAIEYILSGKLFCGYCGTNMTGDSGTSRSGEKHYYYTCHNRKKYKACNKKNEKKDFIEWYVVEQTVEYVLTPERIQYIAERVVEEYEKAFSVIEVVALENQLAKIDKEIDKCVDALINAASPVVVNKVNAKVEDLELRKADAEIELAKLRIASKARITVPEIVTWLKSFCNGDLMDEDFRRRIIDTFINSIYLYDDKLVIYFNVKGGKLMSYMDMLDSTDGLFDIPDNGSDCSLFGEPEKALHQMVRCFLHKQNEVYVKKNKF